MLLLRYAALYATPAAADIMLLCLYDTTAPLIRDTMRLFTLRHADY